MTDVESPGSENGPEITLTTTGRVMSSKSIKCTWIHTKIWCPLEVCKPFTPDYIRGAMFFHCIEQLSGLCLFHSTVFVIGVSTFRTIVHEELSIKSVIPIVLKTRHLLFAHNFKTL